MTLRESTKHKDVIKEGNNLIAVFLEWKIEKLPASLGGNDGWFCDGAYMCELGLEMFNTSWDLLIPVIDEITSMKEYFEYKDYSTGVFSEGGIHINTKHIIETWKDVVNFLKWYNKRKE